MRAPLSHLQQVLPAPRDHGEEGEVAPQLDVVETAPRDEAVGDVEDVVGFVVGQVDLEEVDFLFDGLDETNPLCQSMDGSDSAFTLIQGLNFRTSGRGGRRASP